MPSLGPSYQRPAARIRIAVAIGIDDERRSFAISYCYIASGAVGAVGAAGAVVE